MQPKIGESILKDSSTTQILDPAFAGDAVKFMSLQSQWLRQFIINKDYEAFNHIPESVVYDLGSWLVFVINQVRSPQVYPDVDYSYCTLQEHQWEPKLDLSSFAGFCITIG